MADLVARDLVVRELALHLDGKPLLAGVSFTVEPGQVLVVLGQPGSGKTALLRAIAGLATPAGGTIQFGETPWFDGERGIDIAAERRGHGFVFRSHALWAHRTAFDNVAYGLRQRGVPASKAAARAQAALGDLDVAAVSGRRPALLSTAEQMRVAFARLIAADPAIALIDQPLDRLDPVARREHRGWLRALLTSKLPAAVVTTNDPVEAMSLADRIALLHDGRIVQEGTPVELYDAPATPFVATFLGDCTRIEGTVIEASATDAAIEYDGIRLSGKRRADLTVGGRAIGLIRPARVLVGGGPGPGRIPVTLSAQLCLGDRWELVFDHDGHTLRAVSTSPLKHSRYHLEFPPEALWVF